MSGMSYRARRRWSLFVLVVALPLYIVAAITIVGWFDRPSMAVELGIYVLLGIVWALPLRSVFRGVGKADPEEDGKSDDR